MSLYPSVLDLLDVFDRPVPCHGCRAHAPRGTWVRIDGLRVLTHDGDVICPADRTFGAFARPAPEPVVEPLGVAA
ncbi:hypothetical protein GR925_02490 [Streptomyces sp. HUCO-GS316]|uniref:hypothetical protein n=1 Tax=Streptomyces sp. HUCO-GS316 TaxID=2692198 RepID=UPI00136FE566|nr:hypothetical protein [Streptomyces sp. HUCO-GS316]MXM62343.1 hypothetical protein [Streptomyces sp. HUCO-GS316]